MESRAEGIIAVEEKIDTFNAILKKNNGMHE